MLYQCMLAPICHVEDFIKMCPPPAREETGRGSWGVRKPASRVACPGRGEWREPAEVPLKEDLEESSNFPREQQQEELEWLIGQSRSREHLPSW